jgi:uncharacterized membrane protein HdeD (DUF308 family)
MIDALPLALTSDEWAWLIAGIIALVLAVAVFVTEEAVRIVVGAWLLIWGISAIVIAVN